jgi:hypothetical protein
LSKNNKEERKRLVGRKSTLLFVKDLELGAQIKKEEK